YDRPQERLLRQGAGVLSDLELMALLLRSGNQRQDVMQLCARLLRESGGLSRLLHWSKHELRSIEGIGDVKAAQILAVLEIARRILRREGESEEVIDSPEQIYDYFAPIAIGLEVEKFWVLCMNRKNRPMRHFEITSGTASSCLVHPREVFREA